jgi:hypothetical protein
MTEPQTEPGRWERLGRWLMNVDPRPPWGEVIRPGSLVVIGGIGLPVGVVRLDVATVLVSVLFLVAGFLTLPRRPSRDL